MQSDAKFFAIRYFVVPAEANLFYQPKTEAERKLMFIEALLTQQDYLTKKKAIITISAIDKEGHLYFGKFGKKKITFLPEKTVDDIEDTAHETWPYLNFICDTEKQIIAIEDKSSFGVSLKGICEILSELVTTKLYHHGYVSKFEPIIKENSFWSIVQRAEKIYSLKFKLNSPNLFGASSKANESLKKWQELFHNTQTEVKLVNERGDLKLPESEIEKYREYSDNGGGEWELQIGAARTKKKQKINSYSKVLKITLGYEGQIDKHALKAIITKLLDQI